MLQREMVESNHINLNHNGFAARYFDLCYQRTSGEGNKMLKLVVYATYVVYVFLLSVLSFSALRDNRIQLVKSTATELIITIGDVQLSDDGEYTCSIFTMPVRTARATVTVLGKSVCVCAHFLSEWELSVQIAIAIYSISRL